MATNFSGGIVASDGFKISVKNMPMDVRTRIESISEVELIPLPFYLVTSDILKQQKVNSKNIYNYY